MKLLLALSVLVGGYFYLLSHTTDVVMKQTQSLSTQYQYVADHTDQLAGGQ